MSPKELNDTAKAYVLDEFNKVGTPDQILSAFRTTRQRNFSLATIQKCLQHNGRNMYNLNTAAQGYKDHSSLPPTMPQRVNPYAGNQATSATCPYLQQLRSNDAAGSALIPRVSKPQLILTPTHLHRLTQTCPLCTSGTLERMILHYQHIELDKLLRKSPAKCAKMDTKTLFWGKLWQA